MRTKTVRNKLYCENCLILHEIEIYNPFYDTIEGIHDSHNNNRFSNEPTETMELLNNMSDILEACKPYSMTDFSKFMSDPKAKSSTFSCHFTNIDGNASNFDLFTTTIHQFKFSFDAVGVAETNISIECKNLYSIDGYTSIYQDKIENKKKGSGVALYISEKHNCMKMKEHSIVTEDIESLFAKISDSTGDIYVGVIYRPPNGNLDKFNESLSVIMSSFQSTQKVYIMGDFNINLFLQTAATKLFEETLICNGFNPVISVSTHCKPKCQKSCIDNIFIKNTESITKSGTIKTDISHHKTVFLVSEHELTENQNNEQNRIKITHSYSTDNLDKLNNFLITCFQDNRPVSFNDIINAIQNGIDETCKLKNVKTTKRNTHNNPWISTGLINSIAKRDRLYFKWKKTVSKFSKSGNAKFYEDYRKYRNML